MACRAAVSKRRSKTQSFALVLAGAVHVALLCFFSSSSRTFFKVVVSPANTTKENDGAVTAQEDDAGDATPKSHSVPRPPQRGQKVSRRPPREPLAAQFRSDGEISRASSYLSFLMEPRIMRFSQDLKMPFAGAQDLARQTNTIIKYSGDGDWFPHDGKKWKKIVTIAGESSHILEAFAKILPPTWSENYFVSVLIPRSAAEHFIGDGKNKLSFPGVPWIKLGEMRKGTGAKIEFTDIALSRYQKLRIQGSSAAVISAVSWILDEQDDEYINESRAMFGATQTYGTGMDSQAEIFLSLDEEQSRYVMGAGGATARSIHEHFKVALFKDGKGTGRCMWKLSGKLGDVHAAHHFIVTNLMSAAGLR